MQRRASAAARRRRRLLRRRRQAARKSSLRRGARQRRSASALSLMSRAQRRRRGGGRTQSMPLRGPRLLNCRWWRRATRLERRRRRARRAAAPQHRARTAERSGRRPTRNGDVRGALAAAHRFRHCARCAVRRRRWLLPRRRRLRRKRAPCAVTNVTARTRHRRVHTSGRVAGRTQTSSAPRVGARSTIRDRRTRTSCCATRVLRASQAMVRASSTRSPSLHGSALRVTCAK